MSQLDREFIVEDLYKKTEGGYSNVPGDPETYLSNTLTEWVKALRNMSDEQKAKFPPQWQAKLRHVDAGVAREFMREAGRGTVGIGGQVASGEPHRSAGYQWLPNLSAQKRQFMQAMEDVSAEHTYSDFIEAGGFQHYPECVRYKVIKASVNGGSIRAESELVGAMYEARLLTSEEYQKLHIPPEALANRAPFSIDTDPYRQKMYARKHHSDGSIDPSPLSKFLGERLRDGDLPMDTQTLLNRRFSIMRNDFHLDITEGSPRMQRFANGLRNSTFTDVWHPPAEYGYINPAKFTEMRTPQAHIDGNEVTVRLSDHSVLTYYVDKETHEFKGIKHLPRGMQLVVPEDSKASHDKATTYDMNQHPDNGKLQNPYPNEPVAVYTSPGSQHTYFIPLSQVGKHAQDYPGAMQQESRGLGNLFGLFGRKEVQTFKPIDLTLTPDKGGMQVAESKNAGSFEYVLNQRTPAIPGAKALAQHEGPAKAHGVQYAGVHADAPAEKPWFMTRMVNSFVSGVRSLFGGGDKAPDPAPTSAHPQAAPHAPAPKPPAPKPAQHAPAPEAEPPIAAPSRHVLPAAPAKALEQGGLWHGIKTFLGFGGAEATHAKEPPKGPTSDALEAQRQLAARKAMQERAAREQLEAEMREQQASRQMEERLETARKAAAEHRAEVAAQKAAEHKAEVAAEKAAAHKAEVAAEKAAAHKAEVAAQKAAAHKAEVAAQKAAAARRAAAERAKHDDRHPAPAPARKPAGAKPPIRHDSRHADDDDRRPAPTPTRKPAHPVRHAAADRDDDHDTPRRTTAKPATRHPVAHADNDAHPTPRRAPAKPAGRHPVADADHDDDRRHVALPRAKPAAHPARKH